MLKKTNSIFVGINALTRSFHCSSSQFLRKRSNPGISYQADTFEEDAKLFEEDPEGFGDMESDFMQVEKSHKEHKKELDAKREHVRHMMVKHKYFREQHFPNLLFYAEKEKIRLLNARDPEEWTIEKLAESFPATPETIRKILAAQWKPHSMKRLKKHDEAVMRNWEALKANDPSENGIRIPEELRQHFMKFSDRKGANLVPPELAKKLLRPELPKPKTQEFLSIINSCPKYQNQSERITEKTNTEQQLIADSSQKPGARRIEKSLNVEPSDEDLENETYLLGEIRNRRQMRLDDLKKTKVFSALQPPPVEDNHDAETDVVNLKEVPENPSGTGVIKSNHVSHLNFVEKFQSNEIAITQEDQRRFEISKVKDRIHIPRKLFTKGATYRVDDSYYDDDGEFLYRVPGMVGAAKDNK